MPGSLIFKRKTDNRLHADGIQFNPEDAHNTADDTTDNAEDSTWANRHHPTGGGEQREQTTRLPEPEGRCWQEGQTTKGLPSAAA